MFNDEYLKLETQLMAIDVLMQSINNLLEIIRHNVIKDDLTEPISRILMYCKKIIETIPQFKMQTPITQNQLLNSIEIVKKHWYEKDNDLFTINWFLFSRQWTDFSDNLKSALNQINSYTYSLN
jgi:hypothetical protein